MGPTVLQVGSVSIELKFGNLTMCFCAIDFWRLVASMQQHGSGGGGPCVQPAVQAAGGMSGDVSGDGGTFQ